MDDLISREAAIKAIPKRKEGLGGESWMMTYRRSGYNDCIDACLDAIRKLPSAQPEITEAQVKEYCEKRWLVVLTFDAFQRLKSAQPERNKGKWKVCGTFGDFLKCSCCGYKKPWNDDVFYFCPYCGAEMEENNG